MCSAFSRKVLCNIYIQTALEIYLTENNILIKIVKQVRNAGRQRSGGAAEMLWSYQPRRAALLSPRSAARLSSAQLAGPAQPQTTTGWQPQPTTANHNQPQPCPRYSAGNTSPLLHLTMQSSTRLVLSKLFSGRERNQDDMMIMSSSLKSKSLFNVSTECFLFSIDWN